MYKRQPCRLNADTFVAPVAVMGCCASKPAQATEANGTLPTLLGAAHCQASKKPGTFTLGRAELSQYFAGGYLRGELFVGEQYIEGSIDGQLRTFRFDADDGPVHVWQHALDLRDLLPADDGEIVVLYHYTNAVGFQNVANLEQTASELFASLEDCRAHFGMGVYTSQHEPSVWKLRRRILLNNYSNGSPFQDAEDEEAKRVCHQWGEHNSSGHRGAFCIPLLVPSSLAYNIFVRQTPDLAKKLVQDKKTGRERKVRLGEDYKGKPVHRARDVWVVRITDDAGKVHHASAEADGKLQLLQARLAHLRATNGDDNEKTIACMAELACWLRFRGQRGQLDAAEELFRECLRRYRALLTAYHPKTLASIRNLAQMLKIKGNFQEAEHLFLEAVRSCFATLGENHPTTIKSLDDLADMLASQGRLQEAEPLLRDVVDRSRAVLGEQALNTLNSCSGLAGVLVSQGRLHDAETLYREVRF